MTTTVNVCLTNEDRKFVLLDESQRHSTGKMYSYKEASDILIARPARASTLRELVEVSFATEIVEVETRVII